MSSIINLLQQAVSSDTLGQAAQNGVNETTKDISLWEYVQYGEWYIMVPLGLFSVVAVYIFVERFLAINKAAKEEKNFLSKVKDYLQDGKIDSAKTLCNETDNPAARMIAKGISRIGRPMKDISYSIENVGKLEVYRLEKRLSALATISGAAPMLGFLGTTIGMMQSFHEMQFETSIELSVIAPGILQAMVTTVAGLIVGVLAYIAYNYLVSRVGKVVYQMEGASIEFMELLQEPGK